ncbi:DegQ family serine endoprotease [Niveibacterium terrae]|uniref:DegQ family serine endoprotease n=1 Tax=Niveibacterium terrae TaxID=3373598 RepID=UPI003A92E9DE
MRKLAVIRVSRFCLALMVLLWVCAAQAREYPEFADLVERLAPAVVNISAIPLPRAKRSGDADSMNEFFRRFMPKHQPPPREEDELSLGSGFIVSQDGYILTNAHVIEATDEITVRLVDKREFRARLIGMDKRTDIAVLKIDANNLPRVTLGDVNRLRVGDWVVAIGSPFGFDHTVTAGIVSAKGRSLPDENLVPFIQTDVAINPGNSGGPLFNLKGEVVGINSQIYSETGGFMGLSFAIPIDVAIGVHNQLRATGKVTRGRIGVVIQEVTRDLADSFGLKGAQGALVSALEKNSPAEKAGIRVGDVILRFDGRPIPSSFDLPRIVGNAKPGARSTVQVWQKGVLRNVALIVAALPDDNDAPRKPARHIEAVGANRFGLLLAPLSGEQKRRAKLDGGIAVKDARGLAARAQLRGGDVILSGTRRGQAVEFRSVEQFNRFANQVQRGESISLLVKRGSTQSFVSLRMPVQP